jgi:2-succinyl-5-enolpyruvyl-6-hydroxy-3-cyclohexene-1-carboxylate synthase
VARNSSKNQIDQGDLRIMTVATEQITLNVVQQAILNGVKDFCICPGARNSSFISLLKHQSKINTFYFYDERSAGFFALGRSRATQRPVAVITTSGSATAHLLAPAMEAYYTAVPLLLITADRPRCFRGCNTPQACEQVRLYGAYTPFFLDLEEGDIFDVSAWDQQFPAHINVCLEEPKPESSWESLQLTIPEDIRPQEITFGDSHDDITKAFDHYLDSMNYPLVIVSNIKPQAQEAVLQFLLRLNAPVFLEATSGLREEPRLKHLRITRTEKLWDHAKNAHYPIDAILRIGGVPTIRLWRDLENKQGTLQVFSINESPFSGLSWGPIACTALDSFFSKYVDHRKFHSQIAIEWLAADNIYRKRLQALFEEEPTAEPSLFHALSKKIPLESQIFVGTSLPIREWDLAATYEDRKFQVYASRGINGIDGQISTVLGLSSPHRSNWSFLGDLTTLHDMSGPWVIPQLTQRPLHLVAVNNGGGKIFARLFPDKEIQNEHTLHFKPLADLWSLSYHKWLHIPDVVEMDSPSLIEFQPDNEATQRFWKKLESL